MLLVIDLRCVLLLLLLAPTPGRKKDEHITLTKLLTKDRFFTKRGKNRIDEKGVNLDTCIKTDGRHIHILFTRQKRVFVFEFS